MTVRYQEPYVPTLTDIPGYERVWCVTLATKPHPNLNILADTCARNGISLNVLGWNDGRKQGAVAGFGLKLHYLKGFLDWLSSRGDTDNDLVMYVDGYDVMFCGSMGEIVEAYLSYGVDILFSGEVMFWFKRGRNGSYARLQGGLDGPYPHLCAGVFLGRAEPLRHVVQGRSYGVHTNDQVWWIDALTSETNSRTSHPRDPENPVRTVSMDVDRWGRMGTTMWGTITKVSFDRSAGRFYNRTSRSHPNFLHFDGGNHWKALLPYYYDVYTGRSQGSVMIIDARYEAVIGFVVLAALLYVAFAAVRRFQNTSLRI
jgi:hypothetical protein